MFLVLIIKKILQDGGRGAIVLPDGFLFGEGVKNKIKEAFLEACSLHTVIRLPNGVFNPYTGIKTNLLFFTRGKPTETIWYYEHPYPPGYKSYSKTRPIRPEEFDAEKEWWGNEADGFSGRVENEHAWRVDFSAKKAAALGKAKPHWDKAEELRNAASRLEGRVKDLRDSMKGGKGAAKKKRTEAEIERLSDEAEKLRWQARDEETAGDRNYWPIYNLDIKNPNSPEAKVHDPDELLAKYKRLMKEIGETQEELKDALGAALGHHFEDGEVEGADLKPFADSMNNVSVPGGVEKLREIILILGISGRLTQVSNDQSSKDLVLNIKNTIEKEANKRGIRWKKFYGDFAFDFP